MIMRQALDDPAAKIEGGPEGLFSNGTVSGGLTFVGGTHLHFSVLPIVYLAHM